MLTKITKRITESSKIINLTKITKNPAIFCYLQNLLTNNKMTETLVLHQILCRQRRGCVAAWRQLGLQATIPAARLCPSARASRSDASWPSRRECMGRSQPVSWSLPVLVKMGSFASVGNVHYQVWLDNFVVILFSCYICLCFLPFNSRRIHYVTSRPKIPWNAWCVSYRAGITGYATMFPESAKCVSLDAGPPRYQDFWNSNDSVKSVNQ